MVVFLCWPQFVLAEEAISIQGGGAIPVSEFDYKTGYSVSWCLSFSPERSSQLDLQWTVRYSQYAPPERTFRYDGGYTISQRSSTTAWDLAISIKPFLNARTSAFPVFAILGLGLYLETAGLEIYTSYSPSGTFSYPSEGKSAGVGLMGQGGLGIQYRVGSAASVLIQVLYMPTSVWTEGVHESRDRCNIEGGFALHF